MLIIGAKGFAKEILQVLNKNNELENLTFFDNVNVEIGTHLYNRFPIIKSEIEAENYFKQIDNRFTIGIGNPELRKFFYDKFNKIGGVLTSTIANDAEIGTFGVAIQNGCNILSGVKISNDVKIGIGTIIYYNSIVTHDVQVGDFCEISPNVTLLGRCKIGNYCKIGSGSTILPDLSIGKNVVIGARSLVTKNFPDNVLVYGSPAKIIKEIESF
jgi:sugar O-acyltransferase (sialic acid O-acetyltransferase NeuD family)